MPSAEVFTCASKKAVLQRRSMFRLFAFGDVFSDACYSNHIAGSRAQHRIVPAYEPAFARTCDYLVLMMQCFGLIVEQCRKKIAFQI